jgi:hypothetical protein
MASGVRTEESAFPPIASGVTVYGRALVYHKRMTKEKAVKRRAGSRRLSFSRKEFVMDFGQALYALPLLRCDSI